MELEVFDIESWPHRPQYNIQEASRWTIDVNGCSVKLFGPEWILREKILAQYQRQGTPKESTDIRDVAYIVRYAAAGKPEMDFNYDQNLKDALSHLVEKRPDLMTRLKEKISCTAVFGNW